MIGPAKAAIASGLVIAFVWPFTGTETVMVMTSFGTILVTVIGALKASAAKDEANAAKLAVNGHLLKMENEQEKVKKEREAEFDRLLQVVKDASRAEGEEIARKAAELLAAKVAEGVALTKASPSVQFVPVAVPPSAPSAPVSAPATDKPATRIGEAITELKAAAEETSVAAKKTVAVVDKQHPK